MHVFVAGGTGAVGRRMIPKLLAARHKVTAISRQPARAEALTRQGAEGLVCDVFDHAKLLETVERSRPDAIVNQLTDLPARMNPRRLAEAYAGNDRVRREGTRNLLDAARGASVRLFVMQSMASWYAPVGGAVKTEADPLWTDAPEPIGSAVRTIAEAESAVLAGGPAGIVLRYGGFYGPGTWFARDGDMADQMRKRMFPIVGSGDGVTSFLHVDDAASAVVSALAAGRSGIYNISDNDPAPASDWMPAYAAALGAPPPWRVPRFLARLMIGKALTTWITAVRGASNAKARADLHWEPRYASWRTGFAETLAA